MSDFDLLKALQMELITTLENRRKSEYITHDVSKAKINRLRLQITEIMLRIERACDSYCTKREEAWEKPNLSLEDKK